MGQVIVRVSPGEDAYFVWSTNADAPVSRVMTRGELADWAVFDAPDEPLGQLEMDLSSRLDRADRTGSSAGIGSDARQAWAWGESECWAEGRPEGVRYGPLNRFEVARLLA